MKSKLPYLLPAALTAALAASAGAEEPSPKTSASADELGLKLAVGLDYSTGKYGTNDTEEWWTVPYILRYEKGRMSVKLTIPLVRRKGLGRPEFSSGRATVGRSETSGLGDVVLGGSYNLYDSPSNGVAFDVTGKVKFGTADENKLLGTGENDYAIQGDLYKSYKRFGAFATLGYKQMGDTATTNFRNPWFASVGGTYRLSDETTVGLSYDYRERVLNGGSHVSELTASVVQKLGQGLKLQGYAVAGFADASPDWGAGAVLSLGF